MNGEYKPLSPSGDEIAWHYTDAAGFKGIVSSGAFWATHAAYLNDSSEIEHGARLQVAAYERDGRLEEGQAVGSPTEMFRALAVHRAGGDATPRFEGDYPYITCFSLARDALSQWRGYGRGVGYALGFRVRDLAHLDAQTFKVAYVDEGDDLPVLGTALQEPRSDSSGNINITNRSLAFFKHSGFQEEREVRLVATPGGQGEIKFRNGNLGVTPYLDISLKGAQPVSAMVSPGANVDVRMGAARLLLDSANWHHCSVEASQIPFR